MATLSPAQIAEYAHDAGFRGQDLTVAVAVAMAESGGDTRAHNPVPPDDSYGLWQINMIGSLGPARRDQFDLDSDRELFDPEENARAAWAISGHGDSFRPWTTYTSGAYKKFLDDARRGIRAMKKKDDDREPARGRGRDGFAVDPDALSGYARATRHIADDLRDLSTHQLRNVRGLADDSFGRIGKESGFAAALDHFGAALQRQVKGVGARADTIAHSVSRTARDYREEEQDIQQVLLGLLGDR
ncbi:transglycosylase SLT domain-containing protein [Actinophytocola sp. NPDC049390]|uniref:transglycosylase SLT domain-containing protein n=1 Tax=Actinophytocola sp. NPDC049390 TaxID=3363894 RepID=UPI0037AE26A3